MLVLCTGMARSGSTWSYNVARQLLAHGSNSVCAGYLDAVGEALVRAGKTSEHLVVKTHVPDAIGQALIKQRSCRTIYTYREPLDGILSAMQAFGHTFEHATDYVKTSLDLMRFQVEAGGALLVWYGDVIERAPDVVQAIATYLELAPPTDAVAEIAARLSRDNVRRLIKGAWQVRSSVVVNGVEWDGGTLFSDHHVRANPADPLQVFSAAQIAEIAERLRDYVDAGAVLRPEIRSLGLLGDALLTACWPEPVAPIPAPPTEAEPVETQPVETQPVETPAIEPPPAEALDVDTPRPAAALAVDRAAEPPEALSVDTAPEPPEAMPADQAEPPEAPSIDAASEPPEAPPIDPAAEPPEAPSIDAPPKSAEAPPVAASPSQPTAAPPRKPTAMAPSVPPAFYDPIRDAARRALARDLLRSLGRLPAGKPRLPGTGR